MPLTDADLRNLARDVAAAVARGEDPLNLMRIAYFSGRATGSAAGVRDAAAVIQAWEPSEADYRRADDFLESPWDVAAERLAAAVLALAPKEE